MNQPGPTPAMPPPRPGCLGLVGNILWLVLAGWWLALSYLLAALVMVIFILTIPFVVPCLRLARFSLWPFGHTIEEDPDGPSGISCVGNVLWFVLAGWWLALEHFLAGILLCITIIGIPFGIQCFKLGLLAVWPFGRRIVRA